MPDLSEHHIEERAVVYLKLSKDSTRWEIDSPSNDGSPLFGYDDGPLHEECECRDEQTGRLVRLDFDITDVPELPTLPELHKMIGTYLYPTGRNEDG